MMTVEPPLSVPNTSRRDRLIVAVLLVLFALGAWGIARATNWQDIFAEFGKLNFGQLIILLVLSALNYLLRGLRWHLFVGALALPSGILANLTQFLGGFAMSVTPGRVGELVRVRWLARDVGVGLERAAPVVLADRASDLAALALLLGASVTLSTVAVRGALPVAAFALAAAFIATHPTLLARCLNVAYLAVGRRSPRLFVRLRRAALSLDAFATGGVLLPALILGLLGWTCEAYAFQLLLGWFGADIGLAKALAIFIFSTLAGGLTGAPGGLGGAEAAMVALLTLDGTPLDVAVAATALIRATTLWFAVVIGVLAFPLAERATFSRGK